MPRGNRPFANMAFAEHMPRSAPGSYAWVGDGMPGTGWSAGGGISGGVSGFEGTG